MLLGIDVGSSKCKVSIIDLDGSCVAVGESAYITHHFNHGWAEVNPEDWYLAARSATRNCIERANLKPSDIDAIAVDGPAHNIALLDGNDKIIRPTLHWSDLRSKKESEFLQKEFRNDFYNLTPHPSWTISQLLWLKNHEPETMNRLRKMLVTKDYVRYRLTGEYVTDFYDAIGTQLFDTSKNCWSEKLLKIIKLSVSLLPEVKFSSAGAGFLLPEAAADLGLFAGIPVAVGSGDSAVEAASIGAISQGDAIIKLGTAANFNIINNSPLNDGQTINYPHVFSKNWIVISPLNSGTSTIDWFKDSFCKSEIAEAAKYGEDPLRLIQQLSAKAPVGSDGLLFHPYLKGERAPYWDSRLRGHFSGISMNHGISQFSRSVFEGISYSLFDCYNSIVKQIDLKRFWIIGGGARNELWSQIITDIFGVECQRPINDDASVGSAILAGISVGVFDDWEDAVQEITDHASKLKPNKKNSELYSYYFDIYKSIIPSIKNISHQMGELVEKGDK